MAVLPELSYELGPNEPASANNYNFHTEPPSSWPAVRAFDVSNIFRLALKGPWRLRLRPRSFSPDNDSPASSAGLVPGGGLSRAACRRSRTTLRSVACHRNQTSCTISSASAAPLSIRYAMPNRWGRTLTETERALSCALVSTGRFYCNEHRRTGH